MFELARDVKVGRVTIRKGTPVSDVYEGGPAFDGMLHAIAHPASIGGRVKMMVRREDLKISSKPE